MAREPRQPVGRRLWRRRKRRPGEPALGAAASTPGATQRADDEQDGHYDDEYEEEEEEAQPPPPPPEKRGLFARLFGKKPPPPPPAVVAEDVLKDILALPRGVARLDGFERRLAELTPGSREHRRCALAYHKELTSLANDAGVDLSLYDTRVQACAQALIAAGEDERAGTLYARIGRKHQAAELFVRAGAIDALEEIHAELAFAEGGPRLDARLAFERFEALFLVGRRDEALESLERAVAQWDNPVYREDRDGFIARLPRRSVTLTAGADVIRVVAAFPLILGRGEESAVRIDSPLVSRGHVDIQRVAGALVLKDLVSSGGTRIDGQALAGPTPLSAQGTIDLAGVVIDYDANDARLALRPRQRSREVTLALRGGSLDDGVLGFGLVVSGGRFRVVADGRARLGNDPLRVDVPLLIGDRLSVLGRNFVVSS